MGVHPEIGKFPGVKAGSHGQPLLPVRPGGRTLRPQQSGTIPVVGRGILDAPLAGINCLGRCSEKRTQVKPADFLKFPAQSVSPTPVGAHTECTPTAVEGHKQSGAYFPTGTHSPGPGATAGLFCRCVQGGRTLRPGAGRELRSTRCRGAQCAPGSKMFRFSKFLANSYTFPGGRTLCAPTALANSYGFHMHTRVDSPAKPGAGPERMKLKNAYCARNLVMMVASWARVAIFFGKSLPKSSPLK